MIKMIIWGTGIRTENCLDNNYFSSCDIVGFVDSYKTGKFYGYQIYSPKELKNIIDEIDYVIVLNQFFMEIYAMCMELNIPMRKVIFSDFICEDLFSYDVKIIQKISPCLYQDMKLRRHKLIKMNEKDFFDKRRLIGNKPYDTPAYMSDYFRYRTFEYMAEEIIDENVEGAIAEFGVFRGVFASLINKKFPQRSFYLFDTFEGFDTNEAVKEKNNGYCDDAFISLHEKTSIEILKNNLSALENCVICKGFFPESVSELAKKEKYAFVSIDVDFEESIYQGLCFFYPRLSEGGVIFVHDYNSAFLKGVKNAVKRYEKDFAVKLKKVPLADRAGTLVILK